VLELEFADFAITTLIFDPVFVESLHLSQASGEATRRVVDEISTRKNRPVEAKDIAHELKISMDKAYSKLRYAEHVGVIRQANRPEKNNRKAYMSTSRRRFVPDPAKLFDELTEVPDTVQFVHPLTGKAIVYSREPD
jgi:predicted AAA+ superfamily ATPase